MKCIQVTKIVKKNLAQAKKRKREREKNERERGMEGSISYLRKSGGRR